jgi:hypothetical protein
VSNIPYPDRMSRYITASLSIIFAFAILFISIFRTAVPNYAFSQPTTGGNDYFISSVDYYFPTPGMNPENPLWPLKAVRDKLWLFANFDSEKRTDLLILYADKRLMMSQELMHDNQSSLAVSTASKAEKYLQEAYLETEKISKDGGDPTSSLVKLAKASLKHREVLENMMNSAPDDAKPVINQIADFPRNIYENSSQKLLQMNRPVPTPLPQQQMERLPN